MKPTIDIYYGAPLSIESEVVFLHHLISALEARNESALVFANVCTTRNPHQIDFLIVSMRCVCHVELKTYTAPVVGKVNGPWALMLPGGLTKQLETKNPYRQALDAKYSVSDAMRDFAKANPEIPRPKNGEQFYTTFETVVCVYPQLLTGSRIPSDHKVRGLGFAELIDLVLKPGRVPGWTRSQWIEFAMHLGLARHEADSPAETAAKELRQIVGAYRQRFDRYMSHDLSELVPVTVTGKMGPRSSLELMDVLKRRTSIQIVGESGTGKSHLARHIALAEVRDGGVPIFVPARDYEGRLSSLLTRSVAHLHPGTATELLDASERTATRVSIVLDGFNECPKQYRRDLIKDLQALVLRWPVAVLITGQENIAVLDGAEMEAYTIADLDESTREAVFRCYCPAGADSSSLKLCDGFRTAYELSLAAAVSNECGSKLDRLRLIDAYIRKGCELTSHPDVARRLLLALANHLSSNIKSSATQFEFWQIAKQVCDEFAAPLQTGTDLFDSGLLVSRQGRCAFRHDIIEHFLQSEALLQMHSQPDELVPVLCGSRYRHLARNVIGLTSDRRVVGEILRTLSTSTLISQCLRGECGLLAREVAIAKCNEALDLSFRRLDDGELEMTFDGESNPTRPLIQGGINLPPHAVVALHSVGNALQDAMFLDRSLALARQMDDACRNAFERVSGKRLSKSMISTLYYWCYVMRRNAEDCVFPAAIIYGGLTASFSKPVNGCLEQQLIKMSGTIAGRCPGELFLICHLLKKAPNAAPKLILEVLRSCWQTGVYNLQLDSLYIAHWLAIDLDEQSRSEVGEFLASLEPKGVMLGSTLIETLVAYGMVEPPVSVCQATHEIQELLCSEDKDEACFQAYNVVGKFFEDVYQGVHCTAFDNLNPNDQRRLFVMAALGATEEINFHLDYILDWLLRQSDSSDNLPAYLRWTKYPNPASFSTQSATAALLLGMAGCARHLDEPPSLGVAVSDDHRAWDAYGEILFWMSKPFMTDAQVRAKCSQLWQRLCVELPFQAVDPLERIATSDRQHPDHKPLLLVMAEAFPDELKYILEFGVKNHSRVTTCFAHPPVSNFTDNGYIGFAIHQLELVGDSQSVALLERFIDSPRLDEAAARSIKSIRARCS